MIAFARTATGLASISLLIGTLLVGCGTSPVATGYASKSNAARPANGRPATGAMARGTGTVGAFADDGDDDGGGAPPAAPSAGGSGGGLKPIAKPTPIPAAGNGGAGGGGSTNLFDPQNADDLYAVLRKFGYKGIKRAMTDQITAVTHSYPLGWDRGVNIDRQYDIWLRSFTGGEYAPKDRPTYEVDAVRLAQYRFDVEYYVWVSHQKPLPIPAAGTNGQAPNGYQDVPFPQPDFNKAIPVVKGIRNDEGWLVEISPRGTVTDFFQVPRSYKEDYNHLIPIPRELY